MFSWPRLPSISLPTAIQRRFLSFILKKSLGHLVKPGQLDPAQIDAQIGSGSLRINDVHLDDDAINKYLADLPFPFRLAEGSIGNISVQVPWSNVLSAPFSLSLSSLCLTFVLVPQVRQTGDQIHATDDLAQSVASVAESFIHDELSERENQSLRESLYSVPRARHQPPGSIDPFMSTEDLDAGQHSEAYDRGNEDEGVSDSPMQGVSLLATLLERLLAKFQFDISDVSIRFILPQRTEFIIRIGKVVYLTVNTPEDSDLQVETNKDDGELRTITVSGLSVSLRDITPSSSSSPINRRSASPSKSSSEEEADADATMMTSQILSRSASTESSMYHSATSSVCDPSSQPGITMEFREPPEEMILSLGTRADSIVVSLVTPPLIVPQRHVESSQGDINPGPRLQLSHMGKVQLTITVGPVAIALDPVHMRAINHLCSVLSTSRSVDTEARPWHTMSTNPLGFAFHIKGITVLLLRHPSVSSESNRTDLLQQFFEVHSVSSPSPPCISHLRVQLRAIDISCSSLSPPTTPTHDSSNNHTIAVKASLDDISAFVFFPRIHGAEERWVASPVLVTDPNLSSQYNFSDSRFPSFGVIDWTKGGAAKLNYWRVKPQHPKRKSLDAVSSPSGSPGTSNSPCMQVRIELGTSPSCEVDIVPLHLFIDVGIINGMMTFLDTAVPTTPYNEDRQSIGGIWVGDTGHATPRAKEASHGTEDERTHERRRLQPLIRDDFSRKDSIHANENSGINVVLRVALFRVQVRAPSPVAVNSRPRSGALVVDVHSLRIALQEKDLAIPKAQTAEVEPQFDPANVLCIAQFKTLIAASTSPEETVATTFLSIMSSDLKNAPTTLGVTFLPHDVDTHSLPSICLRSKPVLLYRPSVPARPETSVSFSVEARLSSFHSTISKPTFDGLAFLADDIAQCLFGDGELATASDTSSRSRDPSLIGSRFFSRRTGSTGSSDSGRERMSEVLVNLSITEAKIILLVPEGVGDSKVRPLEVTASDVEILAEIKPEGRDETVVTVGVMDVAASLTTGSGDTMAIINSTMPRSLHPSSKSLLRLQFASVADSETAAKESRLKVTLSGFTYFFAPEYDWIMDLASFVKTPEGAFESVVPSDRTKVSIKVMDGSFHFLAPENPGALVAYVGELDCSTNLVGDSPETFINMGVSGAQIFFIDDISASTKSTTSAQNSAELWKNAGYALFAEVMELAMRLRFQSHPSVNTQVYIDGLNLTLHACADTLPFVVLFASDFGTICSTSDKKPLPPERPTLTSGTPNPRQNDDVLGRSSVTISDKRDFILSDQVNVDENAFRRVSSLGPIPDMIDDDLPTNLDYLDASFGTVAGLRELKDGDFLALEHVDAPSGRNTPTSATAIDGVISSFGGETIRLLHPNGIRVVEGHFENIQPEEVDLTLGLGETNFNLRIRNCDLKFSLYDGYDWVRTRKLIEDEVKAIRRRLAKIRQLLASGQVPDASIEETSTILFNSVHVGLADDPDELEPDALIAAIDRELDEVETVDTESKSSWQSLKKKKTPVHFTSTTRLRANKLARSRNSQIDFCAKGVQVEFDQFASEAPLASKLFITFKDLEILDHIKTSTWKTFLTELRTDFRGNVRETASDMIRAELRIVRPVPGLSTEEGRLRLKILPIKLHVDQDALDFMKKFFSFQSPQVSAAPASPEKELYFQHVEVFPVDLKLDYKPKRVDYRALREGRTIELMNFFHFDGAEITLRHITLSGITGWSRLFETLNDLWTPDVKSNQLADIISGVSPVRSLVNVGSGMADLVLLPIAQYKKDKRVVRGVQKGTTAFVRSTAMEAIKLGARLATGTQVILEQAESVLGGQGQFRKTVTTEALQTPINIPTNDEEPETAELISKYADQPSDVREGMQKAYKSLAKNLNTAAQTILAVPMEVYERSADEGPVRAVVRAVPIAVLKPMIGASEAVSKTLFGLRNTMDPEIRHENEAKYKQR